MKASWLLALLTFHLICRVNCSEKQKRQIFREQVLPSRGGKIPEEAFRADRLALNRLNKEGITVPDGVILEARYVQKHPSPAAPMPEVLKVYLTPDGRYVPSEGRYNYEHPKSVDTTYLVHRPFGGETEQQSKYKYRTGYNSVNKLARHEGAGGGRGGGYREFRNPTRPHIYKPILAPLVIPTREELIHETSYYYPADWNPRYSWDLIYEPFDDYFINGIALFNSHQIITDYEGFLNDYHDRSTRHVRDNGSNDDADISAANFWSDQIRSSSSSSRGRKISKNLGYYPDLKNIPETRFNCGKKRGVFADLETKCQVFHQCGPSGRKSFLCAAGTVFNEIRRRCEWWDGVACDAARDEGN